MPDGGGIGCDGARQTKMDGTASEWAAVAVAAVFAAYCFSYRDALGQRPWLHLLLGVAVFLAGLRRFLDDILNIW